jgi:hypothetical protein
LTPICEPVRGGNLSWSQNFYNSHAALLLVSPALLKSRYVQEVEIPVFCERMESGKFRLFWTLLEECNWQKEMPELNDIQAIGDIKKPINASPTRSDEQCRLIHVVETITKELAV